MREIRRNDNVLEIQDTVEDIGSTVFLNGYAIPSAGIWEIIVDSLTAGERADEGALMDEAERAYLYRLIEGRKLVVTDRALASDIETAHPKVFIRKESQRIRALVDFFDLTIGTIEGDKTPEKVRALIFAAKETLEKNVVGTIDGRYFFSSLPATEFLAQFGTKDWHKVAKFLKRPSPTTIDVDWTGFNVFSEKENDGTVAIDPNVNRPIQGTFFAKESDVITVAKGIVRPPIVYCTKKEAPARVKEAAFGREMPSKGKFSPIGALGRENCTMNYQTVLFSIEKPADLIRTDNKRFEDISAFSVLSKDSYAKVEAGVPLALLTDSVSPWKLLGKFDVPGVRATVYASNLITPGWFGVLPGTHKELMYLAKKHLGIKKEKDAFCMPFFMHRDPALPDGSSMHELRYLGACDFDTGTNETFYGIIINPLDPAWKCAGGDFDGDSASIFLPVEGLVNTHSRGFDVLRTNGTVYQTEDIEEQIIEASCKETTELLGPIILSAIKLAERGMLDDQTRHRAATVAQAAVDAKKHPVNDDHALLLARGIFEPVNLYEQAAGHPYVASLINTLKNVKGEKEKTAAWKDLVKHVQILKKNHPTAVEQAMIERIEVLNTLFEDVGFLRAQIRAELPAFMRERAKAKTTDTARLIVQDLCNEYLNIARSASIAAEEFDDEFRDSYLDVTKEKLRAQRQKIRFACLLGWDTTHAKEIQYAMIGYGIARLAAIYVQSETFQELKGTCQELIINLIGHDWKNGQYKLSDLTPIPSCKPDLKVFSDEDKINLKVVSKAKHSTRVHLIAER